MAVTVRHIANKPLEFSVRWGPRGDKGFKRPSFRLAFGKERVFGLRRVVSNPEAYAGVFRRNENILDCHVDSRKPRQIILLVRELKEKLPMLAGNGFAGLSIDSPNPAIARLFAKTLGMQEIPTPKNAAMVIRGRYGRCAKDYKYPKKYVNEPVRRLVLRF